MAILKNDSSGEACLLRAYHVFGRDAARCDTVIRDASVSRVHAHIRWSGGLWELHDHSSNGTSVSGVPLRDGEHAVLRPGDVIRFGQAGTAPWRVDALDDPADTLWPIRGAAPPIVLAPSQTLPARAARPITIVRSAAGEWLCDDTLPPRTLHDGDEVSSGDCTWCVTLVSRGSTMMLAAPADPALPGHLLEFFVSRNEEHVRMLLHVRGGVVDLGERAHHYSLVTLARARSADMQAGYDAVSQGWIDLGRLAHMLGIDPSHVNVQIHRARSQFAALPGLDASQLVERRRGSVRFGDFPFRIMRGEHLECQSVPGVALRIGALRPVSGPVVHYS
ncbi:FHA domain-containing protein [Burkholderia seminalis]|uniref:FHA domain-containing protein n=1 Tax=Burkholderia TaxID=32008 RepID=UPI000F58F490|nr:MULTISPECIES: FHA domain-containing protein [Burkholderia]MBJ9592686.1 FHA domain-containing protein [Burkholderia seminalis]MBN3740597.1 FHA domain-containing protein [Burkholderia sp. Tr-20355]MCA8299979.1 FHA domain-containing protein [Burkholderia seminalis]RQS85193.1 FHA domain-containing protein [Burkholderia seminalis]RQS88997.1 FHA domain-containing protein [Burkholderia seminalis]